MKKYVFAINGAPHSGKDTLAQALVEELCLRIDLNISTISHSKLAFPIKAACAATFDTPISFWEKDKDDPTRGPFGISKRQWLISFGEMFFKKMVGKQGFAELLAIREAKTQVVIISDLGFDYELDTLITDMPEHEIILVSLTRNNCNFVNDSRTEVNQPSDPNLKPAHTFKFANNSSLADLNSFARRLIATVLEGK